jgi:hypothetical protein
MQQFENLTPAGTLSSISIAINFLHPSTPARQGDPRRCAQNTKN